MGAPVNAFPLLVEYQEPAHKGGERFTQDVIEKPEDLPSGRAFKILKTNYDAEDGTIFQLAKLIHEKTCHYNHADQCGWFYEKNWEGSTRGGYLKKANNIIDKGVDLQSAINTFKFL